MGTKIDNADMAIEVPVSTVATNGFAIPPVVTVDVALVAAEEVWMAVAVPPPAIIANAIKAAKIINTIRF